jgi:uncharacterized BrkB/YihY/UPF0761 family membrane protein
MHPPAILILAMIGIIILIWVMGRTFHESLVGILLSIIIITIGKKAYRIYRQTAILNPGFLAAFSASSSTVVTESASFLASE